MKRFLLAGLGFVLILMSVRVVFASELLSQAERDFQFQLEKYRDEYRSFDLKRGQYQNLQTFASQDELVAAARVMLLRRADVWYAYLQALRVRVSEADGFPNIERDMWISQIVNWEVALSAQKELVNKADNKDALLAAAQNLDTQGPALQSFSYELTAYLEWSYLQSNITQIHMVADKLKEAVATQILDADVRNTRLRGFDEVNKSLSLAQNTLNTVRAEKLHFGQGYDLSGDYKKAMDEFTPSYQQIQRSYQLIKELSLGIEL